MIRKEGVGRSTNGRYLCETRSNGLQVCAVAQMCCLYTGSMAPGKTPWAERKATIEQPIDRRNLSSLRGRRIGWRPACSLGILRPRCPTQALALGHCAPGGALFWRRPGQGAPSPGRSWRHPRCCGRRRRRTSTAWSCGRAAAPATSPRTAPAASPGCVAPPTGCVTGSPPKSPAAAAPPGHAETRRRACCRADGGLHAREGREVSGAGVRKAASVEQQQDCTMQARGHAGGWRARCFATGCCCRVQSASPVQVAEEVGPHLQLHRDAARHQPQSLTGSVMPAALHPTLCSRQTLLAVCSAIFR